MTDQQSGVPRKRSDVDEAYDIQARAALRGGSRFFAIGLGLATIGHYRWPTFRRQTLAFKAFLVTTFSIFGLIIEQENALMAFEKHQREAESSIRRAARLDLSRRGLVPTETEIARWKAEQQQRVPVATEPSTAS